MQTSMAQLNQGTTVFVQGLAALQGSFANDSEFTIFGINPDDLRDTLRKLEREWTPLFDVIRTCWT